MWTTSFPEIGDEVHLVGGKGLALAALARLDVPVPPGFVVTTHAYQEVLRHNAIDPTGPDAARAVLAASFPEPVAREIADRVAALHGRLFAVRSSAVAEDSADKSFAGIFESYLNVPADKVLENVRKCYASLFSARSRHYHGDEQPIAVVVQEMVDSRLSGVLFTTDPVGGRSDVAVVECCHGLGELLVSGEVTPDRYTVDKVSGVIVDRVPGTQAVKLVRDGEGSSAVPTSGEAAITAEELRGLVAIARRIEEHFGFACDIEWCVDHRGPFIVQSRPVTAVAERTGAVDPTYTKRFSARILSPVFEEANCRGFADHARAQFELPFDLAGYHVYQPSVSHPRGEVDIWVRDDLDTALKGWLKRTIRVDPDYLTRVERRYLDTVDHFEAFCAAVGSEDFSDAPTERLVDLLDRFDALNQEMTSVYNAPIFLVLALSELLSEDMRAVRPSTYDTDFTTLALAGIPNSVFLQEVDLLRVLLAAKAVAPTWSPEVLEHPDVRALLEDYHRRWRFLALTDVMGDPFPVTHFADLVRDRYDEDTATAWERLRARQQAEEQDVNRIRADYPHLDYEISWLRTWLFHRNHTTEHYYRDFPGMRPLFDEASRRLGISYRALLALAVHEIRDGVSEAITDHADRAERRLREGFHLRQVGRAVRVDTGIADDERLETSVAAEGELEGQVANRGRAIGAVRVIRDPVAEADRFAEGDILVTAMTTPSFVPLMRMAGAIVTDEGGILCHAALVSRELNKPCVIAVHNATQTLVEGTRVLVDGESGRVVPQR